MIQNIKGQFAGLGPLVGESRGRELVGTPTTGPWTPGARHLPWRCSTGSRSVSSSSSTGRRKTWVIYPFSFDTNLSDEVEAAARAEVARGGN